MITGHTAVFALIGSPVAHSLSPAMQNRWFAEHGIDAVYVALEVPPDGALAPLLGALDGVNLTIPHKLAVVPLLDDAGPDVLATGAANAVVRREGRLIGRNTDVDGFGRAVDELALDLDGAHAVVLGAGGAGRAVMLALARRRIRRVSVLNRTVPKALEAVAAMGLAETVDVHPLTAQAFGEVCGDASLIVNATSGAGCDAIRGFEVVAAPTGAGWVDLNYWMADPPCLERARAAGYRVQTGHRMLLHQGAIAFELFTGSSPTVLPDAPSQ